MVEFHPILELSELKDLFPTFIDCHLVYWLHNTRSFFVGGHSNAAPTEKERRGYEASRAHGRHVGVSSSPIGFSLCLSSARARATRVCAYTKPTAPNPNSREHDAPVCQTTTTLECVMDDTPRLLFFFKKNRNLFRQNTSRQPCWTETGKRRLDIQRTDTNISLHNRRKAERGPNDLSGIFSS